MNAAATILVVDDDADMSALMQSALQQRGFSVETTRSASEAIRLVRERDYDAVVTDLNMPEMNGLELCQRLIGVRAELPVVVVTAFGSMESAIAAIRAGAYDFVPKPFEVDALALTLRRAASHGQLRAEVKRLRRQVESAGRFGAIVAKSEPMRAALALVERVAESDATLLITGESGTGKELIARALHEQSKRASGPFVAVNCAALPEALLESELFGHTRGAFTDAKTPRAGLFVKANGGTLFLDEIGEMPLAMQAKLLRALQEKRVRPLGGDDEIAFDTRIVAATNRDLDTEVAERRFREDLFYRINVVRVRLPPLRARGADVLLIAQELLRQFAAQQGAPVRGLSPQVAERLLAYPWPGNVRELQNCIERALALSRFDQITLDDLPEKIAKHRASSLVMNSDNPAELVSMEEIERRYVAHVLQATGGNKSMAAQVLGFDRKTLYRKLERYKL